MFNSQKLAVFVDVQNMFYSARNIHYGRLDYEKLLRAVVMERKLTRAIAYLVETPDIDQSGFKSFIGSIGWEVKSKALKVRPDGSTKGDWDMGIAIDAISIAPKVDTIVLVSGDGDFVDLINHLKAVGVRVEVHSFKESTAEELINAATAHYPIERRMLLDR
ncbi:uncharacterized LabA/DUF88 family protein [Methanohalophilus euhalobius]|jgi:uncharacterized LabA/DUF88 family protein|uniref:Uncharacterized LabA/DUF88 family protein n=1 Tax=Methanohalophilus euhalobius TaxID=51203 RepID=A0A285EQB9_9EURY|nr:MULTISPECIES: NYN domain-containing protein [Methanohalophilus]ODV49376.1 MAG: hypothetical protein A8273_1164 [Methanohalophilus sp. 2-GBenrich]RXG35236.1 hypothetical protein CI957_260 [Methanohalophilus sp. WG1-DM]TCL11143.1 uncharacterized LabA/DUF88 family protein [Methanohalophilus euhalobius]SNY00276.1 Uncharacterized conserved protein, LabA/DUF88 family [Methanohalophilus euhalobius]